MVGTLIKHEARRTMRWYLLILVGAFLVVGLAVVAAVLLPHSIAGLFGVIAIIGAAVVPGAVPVWLGVDLYRSSYGRTGYLTRALPVKGSTIYWVKLLYAYALSLLALAFGAGLAYLAAIGFVVSGGGAVRDVNEWVSTTVRLLGELPGWFLAAMLLLVVLWPLVWLASYYFAATVGSEAWINKLGLGGPILMWFAFYTAGQMAALLGIFLPLQVAFGEGTPVLQARMIDLSALDGQDVLPVGVFLTMLLVSFVGIVWASVSFDRKVELR